MFQIELKRERLHIPMDDLTMLDPRSGIPNRRPKHLRKRKRVPGIFSTRKPAPSRTWPCWSCKPSKVGRLHDQRHYEEEPARFSHLHSMLGDTIHIHRTRRDLVVELAKRRYESLIRSRVDDAEHRRRHVYLRSRLALHIYGRRDCMSVINYTPLP